MDVLKEVADVETSYGGGFVDSIEGLSSSSGPGGGSDWFYHANGILPNVGAAEYEVTGGDRIWWDYHPWNENNFTPAVIGSYPGPFTRDFSGRGASARILYSGYLESLARQVGGYLEENGSEVSYSEDISGFEPGDNGPSMVVITFEQAGETPWVRDLLGGNGGKGIFLSLEEGRITPLGADGEPSPVEEDIAAAVVASGSHIGDTSPVWLVLCDGEQGARLAGNILISRPEKLRETAGVAVGVSGKAYRLPR
jgi:hypothetical protein